jgi:glycosyltransferase involved in cell wall biosynthesis
MGILSELSHERRQERMAASLRSVGHEVSITQVENGESSPSIFWRDYPLHPLRNLRQGRRKLYFLRFMLDFYRLIRSEKPDVVLAVDPPALAAAAFLKKRMGFHLVYDSREFYTELPTVRSRSFVKAFWQWIEGQGLKSCDEAFTVCASIAQAMQSQYRCKPLGLVRNMPEYTYDQPLKTPSKQQSLACLRPDLAEHPVVVYSGGFWAGYDFRVLMKAFEHLGEQEGHPRLLFLGEGPELEKHKKYAATLSCSEHIFFAGKQPSHRIPALLAACTVGLIPVPDLGLSYRYLLPNKLFEYIQAGLPVLASALPELSSILLGFRVGAVANPLDEEANVKALKALLKPSWRLDRERAFQQASKALCWEEEEKRFLAFFPKSKEVGTREDATSVPCDSLVEPAPQQKAFSAFRFEYPASCLVSVVVPSYNDGPHLARCLRSLATSTLDRGRFEVLVTLDGSSDGSFELLERGLGKPCSGPLDAHVAAGEWMDFPLIVLRHSANQGRSVARNTALKKARGEWILFLDADLRVAPSWMEDLLNVQTNPQAIAVGEMVYEVLAETDAVLSLDSPIFENLLNAEVKAEAVRVGALARYQRYLETRGPWKFRHEKEMPARYFYTCNASVHRELIEAAGSFDTVLKGWGGEDIDMGLRLAQAGGRLLPCPKARALHAQERPFKQHLANLALFGKQTLPYLIEKHPELYRALALHRMERGLLSFFMQAAHRLGVHRLLGAYEAQSKGFGMSDRLYDLSIFLHYAGAWRQEQERGSIHETD